MVLPKFLKDGCSSYLLPHQSKVIAKFHIKYATKTLQSFETLWEQKATEPKDDEEPWAEAREHVSQCFMVMNRITLDQRLLILGSRRFTPKFETKPNQTAVQTFHESSFRVLTENQRNSSFRRSTMATKGAQDYKRRKQFFDETSVARSPFRFAFFKVSVTNLLSNQSQKISIGLRCKRVLNRNCVETNE